MESLDHLYIPDSKVVQDVQQLIRDCESELLFHHSSRVYHWGALAAQRKNIKVDHELLYIACMFHDLGLTQQYCSCDQRFEVDGANAAADFMKSRSFSQQEIDKVWTAIALHTTPGIPEFMAAEIAMGERWRRATPSARQDAPVAMPTCSKPNSKICSALSSESK